MRILWIGFGQAGGKITNTLMGFNKKFYDAVAINTEEADLADLNNIRQKVVIGRYKHKGRGVGADIEVAADIAQKAVSQMMDVIDVHNRKAVDAHQIRPNAEQRYDCNFQDAPS